MRSSRLLALLLTLERTRSTTAPELAAELEVSVRTIYRDVDALAAAGVPVYTTRGAGGGIRLVERWRSPVDGMTAEEVRALAVGGGPAAELGLGSVLAVARSKMRSALPAKVRAELDLVAERFLVDSAAWFRPEPTPPTLATLAKAVWSDTRVDLRYDRGGRVRARRVDPLGLVLKRDVWYLVARHRRSTRTYRASRILEARLRSETFERPPGFDLAEQWHDTAARFDVELHRLPAEVRIPPESAAALRAAVPGALTDDALGAALCGADGRLHVRLRVESIEVAAHQLIGVPGIEVVAPRALREALHAWGSTLAATHC